VTATALFALAIALAVLQSRRSEDAAVLTATKPGKAEVPESEFARCRTISPDDLGLLESCRHIWADNRQHFFLSTKSPPSPLAPAPYATLGPAAKRDGIPSRDVDQSRAH
jgi:conjugative transfer region protein TrbK